MSEMPDSREMEEMLELIFFLADPKSPS